MSPALAGGQQGSREQGIFLRGGADQGLSSDTEELPTSYRQLSDGAGAAAAGVVAT